MGLVAINKSCSLCPPLKTVSILALLLSINLEKVFSRLQYLELLHLLCQRVPSQLQIILGGPCIRVAYTFLTTLAPDKTGEHPPPNFLDFLLPQSP